MTKIAALILGIALAAGAWWAVAAGPLRNPRDAMDDFYESYGRVEDHHMDPLILNGRRVVPLVISDLQDKEMKLRRYAIAFLGNGRYSEALPILEQIVAAIASKIDEGWMAESLRTARTSIYAELDWMADSTARTSHPE